MASGAIYHNLVKILYHFLCNKKTYQFIKIGMLYNKSFHTHREMSDEPADSCGISRSRETTQELRKLTDRPAESRWIPVNGTPLTGYFQGRSIPYLISLKTQRDKSAHLHFLSVQFYTSLMPQSSLQLLGIFLWSSKNK